MLEFLKLQENAFGIDISDQSLKIVKLKQKGKFFSLVSSNQVAIEPGIIEKGVIQNEDALVKIITTAYKNVKGEKLNTKYVVASLPEEKSFLQVIQMPKMEEKELKSAILFEAENYIPLPVSEVYFDYQVITPLKEHINHSDILIGAMPKKIVNSYVSCLKKAGLIPMALEVESEAIARALIKSGTQTPPMAVIDLGENSTNFIVFFGRSIRFTHSISISSNQLTQAISESLKISVQKAEKIKMSYGLASTKKGSASEKTLQSIGPVLEDLVGQIKKYLNFYQDHAIDEHLTTHENIQKILLCGGGANLKGLAPFLSKKVGVPVELGDVWINFPSKNPAKTIQKDYSSFATAIGLALRGINKSI